MIEEKEFDIDDYPIMKELINEIINAHGIVEIKREPKGIKCIEIKRFIAYPLRQPYSKKDK